MARYLAQEREVSVTCRFPLKIALILLVLCGSPGRLQGVRVPTGLETEQVLPSDADPAVKLSSTSPAKPCRFEKKTPAFRMAVFLLRMIMSFIMR